MGQREPALPGPRRIAVRKGVSGADMAGRVGRAIRSFALPAVMLAFSACGTGRPADLHVHHGRFVLGLPDGRKLESPALVGATFETEDGIVFRIDSVAPAAERPDVLLHSLSYRDAEGAWRPVCTPDGYGRSAGFPVEGRWNGADHYVPDPKRWFLTCTSGAQGKCALWGYAPWAEAPAGQPLAPLYQACQHVARADYTGSGVAHTRNGALVDMTDVRGVRRFATRGNPSFGFEAGWGPDGAVCVARTRWPDLLELKALHTAHPELAGTCDERAARARGGLIMTRVVIREAADPPASAPPEPLAEAEVTAPHVLAIRLKDGTRVRLP